MKSSLLRVGPSLVLASFCLVTSTCTAIFSAFDCIEFVERDASENVSAASRFYIYTDMSMECDSSTRQYSDILSVALFFVAVWAIFMPLCYAVLLCKVKANLRLRKINGLAQAIDFLYKEYRKEYIWWEPIDLLRRILLTGAVLLIPPQYAQAKILLAFFVSLLYATIMMLAKPYRRDDHHMLSVASHVCLLCIFQGAFAANMWTAIANESFDDEENDSRQKAANIVGFRDLDQVAIFVLFFNLLICSLAFTVLFFQLKQASRQTRMKLRSTKHPPELALDRCHSYHLFLSHIWLSGQDQVAVIKRQMQRLLNDIHIFLDVDDLDDISNLEMFVEQSALILVFLSSGYFKSKNCLREVNKTLIDEKKVVLCREPDIQKGGISLAEGVKEAKLSLGEERQQTLFSHPIFDWHRITDFQLMTLKHVAMHVLVASPKYNTLERVDLYVEGEITQNEPCVVHGAAIYASTWNPGARAAAKELRKAILNVQATKLNPLNTSTTKPKRNSSLRSEQEGGDRDVEALEKRMVEDCDMEKAFHQASTFVAKLKKNHSNVDASARSSKVDASAVDASAVDASAVDASAVDASAVDASAVDASAVDAPAVVVSEFATSPAVQTHARKVMRGNSSVDDVVKVQAVKMPPSPPPSPPGSKADTPAQPAAAATWVLPSPEEPERAKGPLQNELKGQKQGKKKPHEEYLPTHYLLYLNSSTFVGEQGERLAEELRQIKLMRYPLVMLHENDPQLGGCEFSTFFLTTPEDLINEFRLFDALAQAMHSGVHRDVSYALVARSINTGQEGLLGRVRSFSLSRKRTRSLSTLAVPKDLMKQNSKGSLSCRRNTDVAMSPSMMSQRSRDLMWE